MKYDKIIFACNNDDCPIEYEHVLIRAGQSLHLEEEGMFCTFCEHPMVFCERIEEAGDL